MKNKELDRLFSGKLQWRIYFSRWKKYTLNFDHLIKLKGIKQKSDRKEIYFITEHNWLVELTVTVQTGEART